MYNIKAMYICFNFNIFVFFFLNVAMRFQFIVQFSLLIFHITSLSWSFGASMECFASVSSLLPGDKFKVL